MFYKLWTVTESNGDGSYCVREFANQEEANAYAENMEESSGDDVSPMTLKIEDGKLYFRFLNWDEDYNRIEKWVELEPKETVD